MDEDPDDSDDEGYPGAMPIASREQARRGGFVEEDEEDEEDHVRVVQQKKTKKPSDLKRKGRDDEDEDETDALRELQKHTKEPAKEKPSKPKPPPAAPAEEEDDEDDENGEDERADDPGAHREASYRLWCKNAHKLFKVVDAAVVRESRHAVTVNTHDHYGQLVASNAESLWCACALCGPTKTRSFCLTRLTGNTSRFTPTM